MPQKREVKISNFFNTISRYILTLKDLPGLEEGRGGQVENDPKWRQILEVLMEFELHFCNALHTTERVCSDARKYNVHFKKKRLNFVLF